MHETRVNTREFAKRDFQTSPTNHSGRKHVIVVHIGNEDDFVQVVFWDKNTKDYQDEINGDVLKIPNLCRYPKEWSVSVLSRI